MRAGLRLLRTSRVALALAMRRERAALSLRQLRLFNLRPPAVSASIQPKLLRKADFLMRSLHDLLHTRERIWFGFAVFKLTTSSVFAAASGEGARLPLRQRIDVAIF